MSIAIMRNLSDAKNLNSLGRKGGSRMEILDIRDGDDALAPFLPLLDDGELIELCNAMDLRAHTTNGT